MRTAILLEQIYNESPARRRQMIHTIVPSFTWEVWSWDHPYLHSSVATLFTRLNLPNINTLEPIWEYPYYLRNLTTVALEYPELNSLDLLTRLPKLQMVYVTFSNMDYTPLRDKGIKIVEY